MIKKFRILKFKSKPVIQLKNISKSFGKRLVLKKIDFNVMPGELFGILGPNGCGKSTLFNCICGIINPNKGDIFINSERVNNLPIHIRARKYDLALIPQNAAVFLGLTTEDNLRAVAEIVIKDKSKIDAKINGLITEYKLDHLKDQHAKKLSGGERRRLAIAMSLVGNPKIILMDEPLSHLDPITIDMIKRIIINLQRKNISVIISDHNFSALLSISDRCIVISEGEVIISGNPRDIIHDKKAKEFYFGESAV